MGKRKTDFINLDVLAEKLETKRNPEQQNSFIFDSTTQDIFSLLTSAFKFRKEIPDNERVKIVNKGVFNAAKKGVLTSKSINSEILKEINLYNAQLPKQYILVTKISATYFEGLNRIKVSDETIIFSRYLSKKFDRFDRKEVIEIAKQMDLINDSESLFGWTFVKVFVKARSEHEAFSKAIDSLDLIRGIWNFYFNRSMRGRISSGKRKIINKITFGQIHTLHETTGKLATTDYWYEPEFIQQTGQFTFEQQWKNLSKFEKYVRKQINRSKYGFEIMQALLKYTRALDNNNLNTTFLALWSILENITLSVASYDDVIRRTLFLHHDREFHKQILENLRHYRNQTVHTGYSESEPELETLLFQLKRYVEQLLKFHISNTHKFKGIDEAIKFLDLPFDISTIKEKIESRKEEINLMEKAIKFLST